MPVLLTEAWGGCRVSDAAAEVLSLAQAGATTRGAEYVRLEHVLSALLQAANDPESHVGSALNAVGFEASSLATGWREEAPTSAGAELASPSAPDPCLRGVLRDLGAWSELTGQAYATTLHLLAACLESSAPETRGLIDAGLTADVVLSAGARYHPTTAPGTDTTDDRAFQARGTPGDPAGAMFSVPPPPTPPDLSTRTGGLRSPAVKRLLSGTLPSGARSNTPLGVLSIGRWAVCQALHYLATLGAALLLVTAAFEQGNCWLLLGVPLVVAQLNVLPMVPWLAAKAAAFWLAPAPVRWLILVSVVFELLTCRYEVWMKRVDLADPDFGLSQVRRQLRSDVKWLTGKLRGATDEG